MRRELWLSLAAIAVVAVLLFWQPIGVWLGWLERREVEINRGPTPEAQRLPLFAAERLLQRFGVKTARLPHFDTMPPLGETLVLPGREIWLTPLQTKSLVRWVDGGGHLIVLLPSPRPDALQAWTSGLLEPFAIRWEASSKERLSVQGAHQGGLACAPSGESEFIGPLPPNTLWLAPPLVPSRGLVSLGGHAAFSPELQADSQPDCWVGSAPHYWMIHRRTGSGSLTAIAEFDLFDNFNLADPGHAHLLLGLARFPSADVTVWFPERSSQSTLWGMLARLGTPLWICLALWLAAWCWRAGSRLGPLVPLPSTDRRGLLEHIEATGRWNWRMRFGDLLLTAVREAAMTRAARRDPRWRLRQGPLLRQALMTKLSVSERDLDDAFALGPHPSAETFTNAVRLWEKMRRDV